jgi:hypothetical protein
MEPKASEQDMLQMAGLQLPRTSLGKPTVFFLLVEVGGGGGGVLPSPLCAFLIPETSVHLPLFGSMHIPSSNALSSRFPRVVVQIGRLITCAGVYS